MSETLKVSSFLSLGACDGPSLRSVIFLYGCPLRCDYCHNPETWTGGEYTEQSVDDLVAKIRRNKPYFKDGGGVTVSGGEPLLQQKQVISFFRKLKEEGVNTCMDTCASEEVSQELLDVTDLFLVDIKFLSGEEYAKHAGRDIFDSMHRFLEQTKEQKKPIWIRHVLYPGLTANEAYIKRLVEFTNQYPQIERIDLLPFKSICTTKYDTLGIKFPMEGVADVKADLAKQLKSLLPASLVVYSDKA